MTDTSVIPTPATPDVCSVNVLIEGSEISGEFHILSVAVSNELNRIPRATLELLDGEAAKATFAAADTDHFIPGKRIEIRLGYRSHVDTVFKGIVVKQRIKVRKDASALLVECRDEAVRMTRGLNSRYFIEQKDSEIIEDLIDRHRLQKSVQATTPLLKEVVQYDATDWDFLVCRAEANGQVVTVRDGKVTVATPATGAAPVVTASYGATVLELDAEIDAGCQPTGITATSWSETTQNMLEANAAEPTVTASGNLAAHDLAAVLGGEPNRLRHAGKLSEPELQAWANGRLAKDRLAKVRGRVRFQGFAAVAPGTMIEATGIGKRFQGRQYVSGVRHTVVNGNWETDVQFGLSPQLFAMSNPVSPPVAAGLLPAVRGLQMGVVTALQGDPDGEDRIKVRLPLVSPTEEGTWARLATLDAGSSRGTYFRPEIGDEVVVGFLGNDPRFPLVLGMCHSSAKPAPEPATDDNHHKGYVSRSKIRLLFDDDKKSVVLETPAGNKLALSEADKRITIADQNDNSITLDTDGVTITSAKDLILKAGNKITIDGAADVELKAANGFMAAGGQSAEITAPSTKISGDASTVIKGGTIVRIN
jgi:Rhs element Vgr protein